MQDTQLYMIIILSLTLEKKISDIIYLQSLSEPYLGFECNFRFLQMPYFGRQVTISALSAQPTLVCNLPLQLGLRVSQSALEHLFKVVKGP